MESKLDSHVSAAVRLVRPWHVTEAAATVNRVQRRKRVRECRKRQSVRLAWSIWGHRGAWMTPLLVQAVGTGHIQTKSDQYCLYPKLTGDRAE